MSKHTPGPWIAGDDEDSDYFLVGPETYPGLVARPVVTLHDEANAHLIAAAPELLEALIAITDYTFTASYCGALKNTACRCSTTCPIVAVIAKSRATIAKAIGETT